MNKSVDLLKEIGFTKLTKKNFLDMPDGAYFENFDTNELSDNYWLIYDGDLSLNPEQIELFDEVCIYITGNLVVRGVLNYQAVSALFVLGNIKAESIILSSSICYFGGVTTFEEVLIVMGGSGAPVRIEAPKGPFLYTDSDAAEISVSKKMVNVCRDCSYDESFGSVKDIIIDKFLEKDEDGYVDIEIEDICNAVIKREKILKT